MQILFGQLLTDQTSHVSKEIPRRNASNKAMPPPWRSEKFPMSVPELQGYNKERVAASNAAAEVR